QHPDPFVIADRLDVHAGEPRKLANGHVFGSRSCDCTHGKVLDPVVATGCNAAMTINQDARTTNVQRQQRLMAAVGLVGALAASSCCILPLVLFSLGVSGAWIGKPGSHPISPTSSP